MMDEKKDIDILDLLLKAKKNCDRCKGTGRDPEISYREEDGATLCYDCNGRGYILTEEAKKLAELRTNSYKANLPKKCCLYCSSSYGPPSNLKCRFSPIEAPVFAHAICDYFDERQ